MKTVERTCCVICAHENLEVASKIPSFPIHMGTVPHVIKYLYGDLTYASCASCGAVQLSSLIPLQSLYWLSHNTEIVGELWRQHFIRLSDFILSESKHNTVLEIGDPSAKLASQPMLKKRYDSWTIVEPNPGNALIDCNLENVHYVQAWFSDYEENSTKYDTVILSHVFEHLYNPAAALHKIAKYTTNDARILMSIPDMQHLLKEKKLPPAGMHFEHTFFIDIENLRFLLYRCGFKIDKVEQYNKHSWFISCSKTEKLAGDCRQLRPNNIYVCAKLTDIIENLRGLVLRINQAIRDITVPIYLYGAHFPAQLLLALGIDERKIEAVLDNSPSKIGNMLYGTKLKVYPPNILAGKESVVICHMGIYTEEIKKGILENINSEVVFL